MTTAQMEALNRKTRIIQRLHAGETHRAIADAERVTREHVSHIAVSAGLRVSTEERIRRMKATLALRKSPGQVSWDEISKNLDAWNLKHGRLPKVPEGRPIDAALQGSTSGRDGKDVAVRRVPRVA